MDMNDIFSMFGDIFGGHGGFGGGFGGFGGNAQPQQYQGRDLRVQAKLTLEEAFAGCTKKFKIRKDVHVLLATVQDARVVLSLRPALPVTALVTLSAPSALCSVPCRPRLPALLAAAKVTLSRTSVRLAAVTESYLARRL